MYNTEYTVHLSPQFSVQFQMNMQVIPFYNNMSSWEIA